MIDGDVTGLPERIESEQQLDDLMSEPTPAVIELFREMEGDLVILGVAGKMGVQLAMMAERATRAAGVKRRIIGVARFSQAEKRTQLESAGIETVTADLLDEDALVALPDAPNVVFMAGRKFGTQGGEDLTWAMNTLMPAAVARRYRSSRIVAYSTGNVYQLYPVTRMGPRESEVVGPLGEYAITTLGRERVFQFESARYNTPTVLLRLNYAIDLRYGVLHDLAQKVVSGEPIDLTMGNANMIWQGDAIAHSLLAFRLCSVPPRILNLSGPELVSLRWAAEEIGRIVGRDPVFEREEAGRALITNPAVALETFGYPRVPLLRMLRWTAQWVAAGGSTLGKPTHFETTDGNF